MIALISAVFVASLLGSMHCAGMCGAFLAFAVASDQERVPRRATLHAAYNGGRLITYLSLGVIAGVLGAALDLGGSAIGLQRAAAILAGAMMVVFGVVAILRASGVRVQRLPVPPVLQRLALKGHRASADLPPVFRAGAVGLLTTLLPCGWLYAFVITSAGTGSPALGALTMAAFWLGTLPVMIGLGVGLQTLTGTLRRHLPIATSLLVVIVGLWTILGRVAMPAMAQGAVIPSGTESATEHVKQIEDELPPCCIHER